LYPNTDLRDDREYPSLSEHDGKLVLRDDLDHALSAYLPANVDRLQPYVSPALADDLSNLPPTMLVVCECDPLRDEGELLGRRLATAGVRVQTVCLKGMIHGVLSLGGILSVTRVLAQNIRNFLSTL
jgi:acetyl esterase